MMGELPPAVCENLTWLAATGVWHVVSHNHSALSCADAAHKRKRLAQRGQDLGMPLCDELKSAAYAVGSDGVQTVALLHMRGHQMLDEEKVAVALGAGARRMESAELEERFAVGYGLVTPFAFARMIEVRQLFDESILRPYFPPHTMMTNAGHHEVAVEFRPDELVSALPNASVADIARTSDQQVPAEHTLGILTGNGPESGRLLWKRIDDAVRASAEVPFRGDIGLPRVLIESAPEMGLSMEMEARLAFVRPAVLGGVRRLCERGASVIGIACNTTQFFRTDIEEVCGEHGAQFVSIVDATADALRARHVKEVVFLGIGAVSDLSHWSDFRRIAGEFVLHRPNEKLIEGIDDLAFLVKQKGVGPEATNMMSCL